MITTIEAEEILRKEYHRDNFTIILKDVLLPDFMAQEHPVQYNGDLFKEVVELGFSDKCDVQIYEVTLKEESQKRRVAITQEMFKILRGQGVNNAVVAFVNCNTMNYRISLLTSKYEFDGDKIVKTLSNPRRYSYSLGFGTKTKTAYNFLISKGKVDSLEELTQRFSVEVVNKQFYNEIALCFTKLIGGQRGTIKYKRMMDIVGNITPNKYAEFGVRLIGRIMFCWFLKEKKSKEGLPLIPEDVFSQKTIEESTNYYHDTMEPLFFELLNTKMARRKGKYGQEERYSRIPYLNGGLFSPHADDHYKYSPSTESGQYGVVTIANEWFGDLFDVLGQYNFTVDENTSYDIELSIDPEMLGRIFENLLAEINPETGENAKKSTGSFYTPRDIVDFMVDNSLSEYLKNRTAVSREKLDALISYSKEDEDAAQFSLNEKKEIINALYAVTVLDPACGSGAFPIGMLQKIVYILQEIDPDATLWFDKATENVSVLLKREFEKKFTSGSLDYIRKLSVIQNSIFGVDIQPIAVEIARLRCFLSLVIEEIVHDDEPNRGINPLPNLDFKFIIANSLLGLPNESMVNKNVSAGQISMFENEDHIAQLRNVREVYFGESDIDEKRELKLQFAEIQKEMFKQTIQAYNKQASERYRALSEWAPFDNKATNWFDAEWMFGIKDGFDIVIGNPPYIQLQKAVSEYKDEKVGNLYANSNYATFTKTGDIYCLFYEAGYNLLKANGILAYITSNKWMRAGYGKFLRQFLADHTNPLLLIDFAGSKIFESATVDVNILIYEKSRNEGNTLACIATEESRGNLSVFVKQNSTSFFFDTPNRWVILSSEAQTIAHKIESKGKKLKECAIKMYRGILTGYNDAFIITGETRRKLIEEDPKSEEIIRPILRGRDIQRYSYQFADLWLINTHNGIKDREIPPVDITQYPAIKRHLDGYFADLKTRADQGDTPYNLRSCVYMDDFSLPKIVWSRLTRISKANFEDFPRFCLVKTEMVVLDSLCFLVGDNLEYLIKILNSKYAAYYFFNTVAVLDNGGMQMRQQFVEDIPIPTIDKDTYETDIDNAIFAAFGFTDKEINYIDEFLSKKRKSITV